MRLNKLHICWSLCLCLFIGCNNHINYDELIDYMTNSKNKLKQEKQYQNLTIELSYRPTEFMVWQELKDEVTPGKEDILHARSNYSKYHYFVLSVSNNGKDYIHSISNRDEASRLLNQFCFEMENIVSLTAGKDTLELIDFYSPRYFGNSKSTDILLVFENKTTESDEMKLKILESGLYIGNVSFTYNTNQINKANKLTIF